MPAQGSPAIATPAARSDVGVCQFTGARPCSARPFAVLKFASATGLVTFERHCQSHVEPRTNEVRREGGSLIDVDLLPAAPTITIPVYGEPLPAPEPEPDTEAAAPPAPKRARRSRSRKGGAT